MKVAIVGAGRGGSSVFRNLRQSENAEVIGVADSDPEAPGMALAREKGVPATTDFRRLLELPDLDVIIEATGRSEVRQEIRALLRPEQSMMDSGAANLMMTVLEERENLLQIKAVKEELDTILNFAQEGIQVASSDGTCTYVNPAFISITGIRAEDRIGKNIFDVSPNGALAQVLRTGRPVFSFRNRVQGTNVEVVSNASPIIVDGKMQGAMVVFRDISDVIRLTEELTNSSNIIESLHDELRQYAGTRYTFDDLVGTSPGLREAVRVAKKAARGNSTVLIHGESGTGKEIITQAIHRHSARRAGPFIKVNCAAIAETLLESELFGHEKGAFTGALKTKLGRFELAHGGTIFLDEIGDMNFSLQAKLLRVLQEREFERVGGTRTVKVDVRVLAASNRDLKGMVSRGEFREDLYYRLDVIRVLVPPLRERQEDIPALAESIIRKFNRNLGKRIAGATRGAVDLLSNHNWPGNVRELENVLERAMNVAEGPYISAEDVRLYLEAENPTPKREELEIQPLEEIERQEIARALKHFGTTLEGKKRAARALGVSLATLYNKVKRYELKAGSNS